MIPKHPWVIELGSEEPPDPASHWTGHQIAEALADEVGISRSQIWRILDDLDHKRWQTRSWLTSHDPDFWEKATDVCRLYLDPPDNGLVLSVDRRPRCKPSPVSARPRDLAATS
jgi:hypothetical protein